MFVMMATINIMVIYEKITNHAIQLSVEGGMIENITAFGFLFPGILLLFRSLSKQNLELRLTQFFSVTCVVLFLREVDTEDLAVPYMIKLLSSGLGRNALFIIIYTIIIILTIKEEKHQLFGKLLLCCKSKIAQLVFLGCCFMLIGNQFENSGNMFVEELLEMNGSLLILLASVVHLDYPIYPNHKALSQPNRQTTH